MSVPPPGSSRSSYPEYSGHTGAGLAPASDERSMAMLAHLATIVAMIVSVGWLSFVGPLLVWLWQKDKSAFVRRSAAGAFNFNLSMWLLAIIGWVCFFTVLLIPVAIVLWIVSGVAQLWCHIRGAMLANRGELYRYPLTFVHVLS